MKKRDKRGGETEEGETVVPRFVDRLDTRAPNARKHEYHGIESAEIA